MNTAGSTCGGGPGGVVANEEDAGRISYLGKSHETHFFETPVVALSPQFEP